MYVSPAVNQLLKAPWVEHLLLTGQPSIRREICLCVVWSWEYPQYIFVLGEILSNVKQRQFCPLCFIYMHLISLMDISPLGNMQGDSHT